MTRFSLPLATLDLLRNWISYTPLLLLYVVFLTSFEGYRFEHMLKFRYDFNVQPMHKHIPT